MCECLKWAVNLLIAPYFSTCERQVSRAAAALLAGGDHCIGLMDFKSSLQTTVQRCQTVSVELYRNPSTVFGSGRSYASSMFWVYKFILGALN